MENGLSPEYIATLQRMTGQQKLRTAFSLYWSARKLKAAALRLQHPDWSQRQVEDQVKQIFLHASS
ncbi:MAG: hypothetical protein WCL19_01575 [Verrucomicrobiota bacterium]|jgi:DNA-binding transcriptional regulator WhiA